MHSQLLGIARAVVRRILPVSLRRRLWSAFASDYFERTSIKAIVAHSKGLGREQSAGAKQLIEILEETAYRPDYALIRDRMGLEFKAFSCQDLIAYLFFNGCDDKFFIDIGAFDGVEISNTYALERMGWKGICIEPIPEVFAMLK